MITATVNGTKVHYTEDSGMQTDSKELWFALTSAQLSGKNPFTGNDDLEDDNFYNFLEWCHIVDPEFTVETEHHDAWMQYRVLTEGDALID